MIRAAVYQRLQLGVEATAGTGVAANKRLQSTEVMFRPRVPLTEFRAVGDKFPSDETKGKDWSEGTIRGVLSFTDIVYLLSSVCHKAAVPGTWTFIPAPYAADDPQTYTFEYGSASGAEKCVFGVVTGLDLRFSGERLEVGGSTIGRTLQEGVSMTASPTNVAKANADPAALDFFMGNSIAGLTKITNGIECRLALGNKIAPWFAVDSAQSSYTDLVERAPDVRGGLDTVHDSVSQAWDADMRAKRTKFFRAKVLGPVIGAGPGTYSFQVTCAFRFREPDRGERNDAWASMWGMQLINDDTLGGAIKFEIVNEMATL